MTNDPILASASFILRESLQDFRNGIDGLPVDALNWMPVSGDTNSITVLATHTLNSTRWWLSVAVGAPLPKRDRDSEFTVSAADSASLMALVDDFSGQCNDLLKSAADVDWGAMRQTQTRVASTARPGQSPEEVPAAFALIHAIAHLREHVAHVSLTRQLWEQQANQ